ncbi:hypothetical protein CEXT_10261 [Caerostris extrusa]|uniref:Uncharacterized protein n=1 Tax=Caerostris extrusa TaxID=172846 RepID=A0AAV4NHN4_CAEEX|nr:hypothetical protein CEXT_10261 [Caerostris extrusa]
MTVLKHQGQNSQSELFYQNTGPSVLLLKNGKKAFGNNKSFFRTGKKTLLVYPPPPHATITPKILKRKRETPR